MTRILVSEFSILAPQRLSRQLMAPRPANASAIEEVRLSMKELPEQQSHLVK
jgi:hypothetical protein